eukprot:TRINITY_DN64620_c0_g1_i1.p1 TRINITY_DN64620_c0_g1~~TRINITY_DN64620_c0_g1_i1.p1  ORF type:complete len:497 (+),score=71.55 TRINITY_DN64620_c0_g1_i1:72-1562(+)
MQVGALPMSSTLGGRSSGCDSRDLSGRANQYLPLIGRSAESLSERTEERRTSSALLGLSKLECESIQKSMSEHASQVSDVTDQLAFCSIDMKSPMSLMVVGVAILISVLMCWLEIDFPEYPDAWFAIEVSLSAFFWIEAILRISQQGFKGYFMDWSCRFDFFLVICGTTSIIQSLGSSEQGHSMFLFSAIMRLARFARIIRLFTMFRTLRVLVSGFSRAAQAVLWVAVLVIILIYSCALVLTIVIGQNAQMWDNTETETMACLTGLCPMNMAREEIDAWFGTVPKSMFTLFMITTLANWPLVVDVVSVQFWPIALFVVPYIALSTYTVLSLITAVMSENIINAVREDDLNKVSGVVEDRVKFLKDAHEAWQMIDSKNQGEVTLEEFEAAMLDPNLKALELCVRLGISGCNGCMIFNEEELLSLFSMFHNPEQSRTVRAEDFVAGLSRMRGGAGAMHVASMEAKVRELHQKQQDVVKLVASLSENQLKILETLEKSQ